MRVLVTGIFDLLHVEHVRFLAAAKTVSLGGGDSGTFFKAPSSPLESIWLIVGIESDTRVRKLKGEGRPVMGQADRKEMLMGLKMVDEVMILPDKFDSDDDYLKLLRQVKPDIYAVSENSPYMENKKRLCDKAGVKCIVVRKFNPEYSTSSLIKKIASGLPQC